MHVSSARNGEGKNDVRANCHRRRGIDSFEDPRPILLPSPDGRGCLRGFASKLEWDLVQRVLARLWNSDSCSAPLKKKYEPRIPESREDALNKVPRLFAR